MFQLQQPSQTSFERMVDEEGTSITLQGRTRYGALAFEYHDPPTQLTFKFEAERNHHRGEDNYWSVFVPLSDLVPAVLEHPELKPESFKTKIFAKIEAGLLAWPPDPVVNPVTAKGVTFVESSKGKSLTDLVIIAQGRRHYD